MTRYIVIPPLPFVVSGTSVWDRDYAVPRKPKIAPHRALGTVVGNNGYGRLVDTVDSVLSMNRHIYLPTILPTRSSKTNHVKDEISIH